MATETRVDYLKGVKLVPPWHSKSKVWCYFGFKEKGGDNEFVYCALCKMRVKYCWNTTNLLSHSMPSKIKPSLLPSELSGVIESTLGPGRWKLRCDPSQITPSKSLINIILYTLGFTVYIFWNGIHSKTWRLHVGFEECTCTMHGFAVGMPLNILG